MSTITIIFPSVEFANLSIHPLFKGLPDGRAVVDTNFFFKEIYPQARNLILQGDREGLANLFSGRTIPNFKISIENQVIAEKEILIGSMFDGSLDEKIRNECAEELKTLEYQLAVNGFRIDMELEALQSVINPHDYSGKLLEWGAESVYKNSFLSHKFVLSPLISKQQYEDVMRRRRSPWLSSIEQAGDLSTPKMPEQHDRNYRDQNVTGKNFHEIEEFLEEVNGELPTYQELILTSVSEDPGKKS